MGVVVGLNSKTASVEIVRNEIHSKYLKPIRRVKKIQAHNDIDSLKIGDKVLVENSRPFSATKRFLVIRKEEK